MNKQIALMVVLAAVVSQAQAVSCKMTIVNNSSNQVHAWGTNNPAINPGSEAARYVQEGSSLPLRNSAGEEIATPRIPCNGDDRILYIADKATLTLDLPIEANTWSQMQGMVSLNPLLAGPNTVANLFSTSTTWSELNILTIDIPSVPNRLSPATYSGSVRLIEEQFLLANNLDGNASKAWQRQFPSGGSYPFTAIIKSREYTSGNRGSVETITGEIPIQGDNQAALGFFDSVTVTPNTVKVLLNEAVKANAPFYGLTILNNNEDITNKTTSAELTDNGMSVLYRFPANTFGANDIIKVSIDNAQTASPGHYFSLRENKQGNGTTPQLLWKEIVDANVDGLIDGIQGLTRKYSWKDIEKTWPGNYQFQLISDELDYMQSIGKKLFVGVEIRTFGKFKNYKKPWNDPNRKTFAIPGSVVSAANVFVDINNTILPRSSYSIVGKNVVLNSPANFNDKVRVTNDPSPFPTYTPKVGIKYANNNSGWVHNPWKANTVARELALYRALAKEFCHHPAFEGFILQETALGISGDENNYSAQQYVDGLVDIAVGAKKACPSATVIQSVNQITKGQSLLTGLVLKLKPWGIWAGGPDILQLNTGLNNGVYDDVDRALHGQIAKQKWIQHDSYKEWTGTRYLSPQEQFQFARTTSKSTASGKYGLGVNTIFWNATQSRGKGCNNCPATPYNWENAWRVVANNPQIQTEASGLNNVYHWQRPDGTLLPNSTVTINFSNQ